MHERDNAKLQSIDIIKYILSELFTRSEYDSLRATYNLPALDTAARHGIIYPAAWEPYMGCDKDGCLFEGKRYFYRFTD